MLSHSTSQNPRLVRKLTALTSLLAPFRQLNSYPESALTIRPRSKRIAQFANRSYCTNESIALLACLIKQRSRNR